MSTYYTYLLFDDFDWCYSDKSKEQRIEELKKELPVAEVLASFNNYIVVDLDENSPWGDNVQLLKKYCHIAYYYGDEYPWNLQKVEFKKPEVDTESIVAPPAQRIDRRAYYKALREQTSTPPSE